MKAITLLVVLALVALASATTETNTYTSIYAYWYNLVQSSINSGTWLACLYGGALSVFFANDGGNQFYKCLV
jgi:hypothetical protein